MDLEVSRQFQRLLSRQGLGFKLGTKVTERRQRRRPPAGHDRGRRGRRAREDEGRRRCWSRSAAGPTPRASVWSRSASRPTTMAASRSTATSRPTCAGIYAIGDVIEGPMLAHKAEDEGVVRRRASGRAEAAHRLRRDSRRGLHGARGRLGRQDRGAAQGGGHRLQGGQVPVLGQPPGPRGRRDRRLRQDPRRRRDRPGAGRPHHRRRGRHHDRRGGARDGVRRLARRIWRAPATPIRPWRRRSRKRRSRPTARRSTSEPRSRCAAPCRVTRVATARFSVVARRRLRRLEAATAHPCWPTMFSCGKGGCWVRSEPRPGHL